MVDEFGRAYLPQSCRPWMALNNASCLSTTARLCIQACAWNIEKVRSDPVYTSVVFSLRRLNRIVVLGENLCRIPATCDMVSITTGDDVSSYLAELQSIYPQPRFPPEGLDSLCIGLRYLSTRLVDLWLEGMAISTSLYWPDEEELLSTMPYWPKLKCFQVYYSPASASGEYLSIWEPE